MPSINFSFSRLIAGSLQAAHECTVHEDCTQGSHFFGLTKFHDISMIFPGFLVNVQVFIYLFLKWF